MTYFLRELVDSDKDMIFQWRNAEEVRVNMLSNHPIMYKEHCRWFEDAMHNSTYFRVFIGPDKPLGFVSFKKTVKDECVWGFYIGEQDAPKGSGTIMATLAIDYAFYQLNMNKIIGEVLIFNKKSQGLHLKLGFEKEGVYQNQQGKIQDVFRFVLSKEKVKFRTEE